MDRPQRMMRAALAFTRLADFHHRLHDKLQGGIDRVNKSDQLQLIHIQDLNSRVAQATQLASNLMSSQQQAMSAVIHNLKA